MEKKYELTEETIMIGGRVLHKIKALKDFSIIRKGDLGGFIESEKNLSHEGNSWVFEDANVYGNAWVNGSAKVYGNACVYENAEVRGNAKVSGYAEVFGDTEVFGNAEVCENAWVYGNACVYENAEVYGSAKVCGSAKVFGNAEVFGNAKVCENAWVYGNAEVCGNHSISDDAHITSNEHFASVTGFGSENRTTTFYLTKDNTIRVVCGCFKGTLDEFREQVKKTYPPKTKYRKEYLLIAVLMEERFEKDN